MLDLTNRPPICLDHNATAPLHPAAREAMRAAMDLEPGNPSSVHASGQLARGLVERARRQVAAATGARPSELVWTSGATEANGLAWRGVLLPRLRSAGRAVAWLSEAEHPSLHALAASLAAQGVEVHTVAVDGRGGLDLAALQAGLAVHGADLISVVAVGSELGTVYPVAQLAALAHAHGALVHTDAAQAWGRIPLDFAAWQADLVSLSGHKIGGPMGTGVLWVRRGVRLQAAQPGHQEQGLRGGTENVLGIVGVGAAAAHLAARLDGQPRLRLLRDRLWQGLQAAARQHGLPQPVRWGEVAASDEAGHVLCLGWPGIAASTLVMALDLAGVAASAGPACASGTTAGSALLRSLALAAGWPAGRAAEALRLSLGPGLSEASIDDATVRITAAVARLHAAVDRRPQSHYAAAATTAG